MLQKYSGTWFYDLIKASNYSLRGDSVGIAYGSYSGSIKHKVGILGGKATDGSYSIIIKLAILETIWI
jgi:hypothetical protein